jgi:hypothetical protein
MKLLQGVRRAMFSEPLLTHPAETGGGEAVGHPHLRDDGDRDQHEAYGDDEEHMVVAAMCSAYINGDRRPGDCLCACAQGIGLCIREQRN